MRRSSAPESFDTPKPPDSQTPDSPDFKTTPDSTTAGHWDWDVVSRLLEDALARPATEREAFLLDACGGDRTVFEEVASLAAAHDAASLADDANHPLERLASALHAARHGADDGGGDARGADPDIDIDPDATVASVVGTWPDRSCAGQRIGPYALVREIGRGGMGVVYLARRVDGQYDRDVALKLLRKAAYDARHRERFLAERQFLAMLSHPHIARMFDGGVTAAGQPFFTMEYVDGVRIDRYCDEQRASIPERIRLFLQVCDAVSAAHRSLVVHRDIKPNNVLVTRDGMPKLLDFGIAMVLDADTGEAEAASQAASQPRLCTPAYASPEQIRGGTVTAASDVYSLGAVLYELLTGLKPSRAGDVGGPVNDANGDRAARRSLGGDLDAIVRKAMHVEPAQRYASVDQLRDDLECHLQQLPVSAHPGGLLYRARKFVTRHRAAVAACVLVVLSLAAGTTVTLVQANRARAREEAAVAEAAMRTKYELAMTLHHKGDITQAAAFFREAVEHGRRMPHVVNSMRVDSVLQLARLLHLFERDPAAAEPLYREAVDLARVLHREPDMELATALQEHARVLYDLDRPREAEAPAREALALWRRLDGAKSDEGLGSVQMLGDIVSRLDRDDEAEALYREALALGIAVLKEPHPHLIGLNGGLAFFLEKRGRIGEAKPLREIALRNAIALYGDTHPLVARALTGLGDHHIAAGAFVEAERVYQRAVAVRQNIHPAPHWRIAEARSRVGYALFRQQRYQEAEALLKETYERMSSDSGAIPDSAERARLWLVELYDAWDRPREAARYRALQPPPDDARRSYAVSHGPR
jgi:serine/threonine-protein kinase